MSVRISVIILVVALLMLAESYLSAGPASEASYTSQVATPSSQAPH
jgi:hypothetical protein